MDSGYCFICAVDFRGDSNSNEFKILRRGTDESLYLPATTDNVLSEAVGVSLLWCSFAGASG